jgi:hypothetical protein
MKTTLIVLTLSASLMGALGDTNQFYLTDDFVTHYGDSLPFTPEQVEAARHAKECRPAEQDPEGHWGEATEGFQLSIRLQKESFTNGEPVTACVILRNVSGKLRRYFTAYVDDPMLKIVVLRGRELVRRNDEPRPGQTSNKLKPIFAGSMWSFQSPPGTQRKFPVELNKVFDLTTNGEYEVYAMRTIPSLDKTSEKQVVSGKATFRITDPPKPRAPNQ